MCSDITLASQGRRHYVRGNTYPHRDALRSAGAHWDGDARAWWIGKRDVAEQLVAKLTTACGLKAPGAAASAQSSDRPAPGKDAVVAGKASYKGRTYYVAGRVVRGRTQWDDSVTAISTRDGAKVMLFFRDGSKSFWAARNEVQIVKSYQRAATIEKLERLSAEWREARANGDCACSCHREPNAGAPGSILYDGCDRCGCDAC